MLRENDSLRRAEVVDDGHAAALTVEGGHSLGDVELRLRSGFQLLRYDRDVSQRRLNQLHQLVETRLDLFERRISRLSIQIFNQISRHFFWKFALINISALRLDYSTSTSMGVAAMG